MGFTTSVPADATPSQPTVEERRALIERVAASEHFRRSARLRDFLLYVGGQSLKQGCPEINEQDVGSHVFGRSASYDRSQDNIVRVNATELRKRINAYFAGEGAEETLVLEIPRGGYRPVFHRRVPQTDTSALPSLPLVDSIFVSPEAEPPSAVAKPRSIGWLLWAGLTLSLTVACVVLLQQNRALRTIPAPWREKPAMASFWGDFLRYDRQTDVVLPDDSVSLIEDLADRPISLGDYLNRSFMSQIKLSALSQDRKSDLDQVVSHNLVTFGGVRAAQDVLAQIPSTSTANLTLSRYYIADAIKRNNVILIGGKKANPWVHLFDQHINFVTDFDYEKGQAYVANLSPKPGELTAYTLPHDQNELVGYSVIAYLPNPARTGNAIILAGTDSDATDAAAEFLTSEEQLKRLRDSLRVTKLPYFEVLLKTSRLSGTSFSAELLSYRTYPDLH